MAFEFDSDKMFKMCALYLSKGRRIVRCHGIWPDGRCTCGDPDHVLGGAGERNIGKHPHAKKNWGDTYARTEDDILEWIEDRVPFNVGLILGPEGGVIDSEDDDSAARAYRESIGMTDLVTWTWTSGKSTHQATAWDDVLSDCKGVMRPGGLEVRTGAGKKQVQSIMPPSWHRTGVQYKWNEGLGPDDVPVAPTPRSLLIALSNGVGSKRDTDGDAAGPGVSDLFYGKITEGHRHPTLLKYAWWLIVTNRKPTTPMAKAKILDDVLKKNAENCVPPKAEKLVRKIVADAFEHYRVRRNEGWSPDSEEDLESSDFLSKEASAIEERNRKSLVPAGISVSARQGYELHGLTKTKVGSVDAWDAGDWSIEMIHSDPPEIALFVPAWEATPCHGVVHMTLDTFRSANKVASLVFNSTRGVILDGDAKKWAAVWRGVEASKKTGGQSIPGIMERLIQKKEQARADVYVGTSSLRYAQLAGFVMQVFRRATKPRDETKPEPNESGRPCWVNPDELWFQWGKIWDDISRSNDVVAGERTRIRSRLLAMVGQKENKKVADFVHRRHQFPSGRLEYVVFTKPWLDALESLASGEEESIKAHTLKPEEALPPEKDEQQGAA
jgi:hypothetical protein